MGKRLAILAGCAVGPNYNPPSEQASVKWATQLTAGESDAPAALASWWTSFKDPDLDALISIAVGSNLTLRVAEEHVREARAERDVVAGGRWPSVGASGSTPESLWRQLLSTAQSFSGDPARLRSLQRGVRCGMGTGSFRRRPARR